MSPYNTSSPLGYVVNLDQHISLSQGNEKLIATSLSLVLLYLIFYWKTSKTVSISNTNAGMCTYQYYRHAYPQNVPPTFFRATLVRIDISRM